MDAYNEHKAFENIIDIYIYYMFVTCIDSKKILDRFGLIFLIVLRDIRRVQRVLELYMLEMICQVLNPFHNRWIFHPVHKATRYAETHFSTAKCRSTNAKTEIRKLKIYIF